MEHHSYNIKNTQNTVLFSDLYMYIIMHNEKLKGNLRTIFSSGGEKGMSQGGCEGEYDINNIVVHKLGDISYMCMNTQLYIHICMYTHRYRQIGICVYKVLDTIT